jgi:hypothetical protein
MMMADIKVQAIPFQDSLCFDFDAPMLSAFPVSMEVFEEFGLRLLGFVIGDNKISVKTDRSVCFLIKKYGSQFLCCQYLFWPCATQASPAAPRGAGFLLFCEKRQGIFSGRDSA